MTPSEQFPARVVTWRDVAQIEALARRAQTPCGDGVVVWRIWGDGDPLLLLHGGSGSWNHWVRNISALVVTGRTVVVPDMPGFGESASPPVGQDADALPPWLERGLVTLVGGTPCDVVGFSFGALVSGFFTARYPDRVRRLVLVGAPALSAEVLPPLDLRRWQSVPVRAERNAIHRHNLRTLMLAQDESIDELAIALHAANVERDRMRKRRLMLTDALLNMLPVMTCPLDGIWGAEDVLYRSRHDVIGRALAHAPDLRSLTLIPEAGHWVQYERAAIFNEALRSALSTPARVVGR
jgi:2-hydroxy-6-oxonona-2,4-dienedioate hydrolase